MSDYILKYNDSTQHYFYLPNQGLCVRNKVVNLWQNHKPVFPDSTKVFSVFCDKNNTLHAICTNSENCLVYLIFKNNHWQSYVIARLKPEMQVFNLFLFETRIGLSILYTAGYGGEILLIHCVLGDHAMPETIAKLSNPYFYFFKNRVYYTNSGGILGYCDISDGKADTFNKLVNGGDTPYIITHNQKDLFVFKKDSHICFQNRPVQEDKNATHPILVSNKNQLLLMWQNNDFIRYMESNDCGNSWSNVMQYVNPGKTPHIYHVVNNCKTYNYFGNHSSSALHIYGKNDIFEKETEVKNTCFKDPDNITKLKILIEMQKKEICELKREIIQLGDVIKAFKEENSSPKCDNSEE